jgi:hypothetical protein
MSLYEARGNLAKAFKELSIRWVNTKMVWSDDQARRFEEEILLKLERDLKQAGEGIDAMQILIQQARRDCSP